MTVRARLINRTVTSSPMAGARTDEVYVATSGWAGGGPPLVLVHGAGFRTSWMTNHPDLPQCARMVRELAKDFTVYVSDLGGDWWGSPDHLARIDDARSHLATVGGSTGPVTLVGFSMGGLAALNYARAHPADVRAVATIFPVVDLAAFKAANDPTNIYINPCYSGGYSSAVYGALHDPAVYAADLPSSVPVKVHYSDTDPVIPVSTVTAFAAARPSTLSQMVGHGGHTDATIGDALPSVLAFCRDLS